MKENEMKEIARIFTESIKNHKNEEILKKLRLEVIEICEKFPIYNK
jgi:hypothetical protein